jgi:hypothetical protein
MLNAAHAASHLFLELEVDVVFVVALLLSANDGRNDKNCPDKKR